MLIWDFVVSEHSTNTQTRLYAKECASDLATAYLLNSIGVYKASRLCLRSCLENAVRVAASAYGLNIHNFKTIPNLFRSTKEKSNTYGKQKERIEKIYQNYNMLCKTSHSTSIDFMSLRIPFETVVMFDESESSKDIKLLEKCTSLINEIFYICFSSLLDNIDHKNSDLVRDSVQKNVKTEAAEIRSKTSRD